METHVRRLATVTRFANLSHLVSQMPIVIIVVLTQRKTVEPATDTVM